MCLEGFICCSFLGGKSYTSHHQSVLCFPPYLQVVSEQHVFLGTPVDPISKEARDSTMDDPSPSFATSDLDHDPDFILVNQFVKDSSTEDFDGATVPTALDEEQLLQYVHEAGIVK